MPGISIFQKRKAGNPTDQSNSTTPNEGTPNAPNRVVPAPKPPRPTPSEFSNWGGSIGGDDDFSFTGGNDEDVYFDSNDDFMDYSDTESFFGGDNASHNTQGESLVTDPHNQTEASVGFARFASRKPASEATPTDTVGKGERNSNEANLHGNRTAAVTPNHRASNVATSSTEKDTPPAIQERATAPQEPKPLLHSTTNQNFLQSRPLLPTRANGDSSRDKTRRVSLEQTFTFSRSRQLSKPSASSKPTTKSQPKIGNSIGSILSQHSKAAKPQPQNQQLAPGRNRSNETGDHLQPRIQTNTRGNPLPNAASTNTAPLRERTMAMFPPNDERSVPQTKQYANFTDNRAMRNQTVLATAVTPNPRNNAEENSWNKNLSPQANEASRTETAFANTLAKIQPNQEEPNTAVANQPSDMESNQAKFRSTVRETEDLQDKIEQELLDLNDEFSDTYSLLLGDLEKAVDLLDKLETLQESADEAIALHQQEIF